ncbi:hypothetical protein JCM10908_005079 [Rhodotorula pacifica]|uniref:Zn(II)2Cys6 transcription factor domain-containing protein n=1 Tax=Rhodotorula pacifica TaxID=1495444 RepID=UPI0031740A98
MRTKPKALRAPRKTDDWRPNRIRSKAFLEAISPPAPSADPPFEPIPSNPTTLAAASVPPKPPRQRLKRACKEGPAPRQARSRRTSAASSAAAKESANSSPASSTRGSSPPSSAASPPPPPPPPAPKQNGTKARKRTQSYPPDLPPELMRLVHPSSAILGSPTEKPGRGSFRSCDACSRRREKCDRYTVCGSCIIHDTLCIWSKCKPLYKREGNLPGGASENQIAARQAEADQLRRRINELAKRAGLQAEELLDPEKMQRYLKKGLPQSRLAAEGQKKRP